MNKMISSLLLYMKWGDGLNLDRKIKMIKRGNKEVLIDLVLNQKDEYYKLEYTYLSNEHDSMDALQEMIVIVYENIHTLKKHDSFYSWSKTILVNCCKKILKGKKKVISLNEYDVEDEYSFVEDTDEKRDLINSIKKLNKKHQEILKLRYFLDMEYSEFAKCINIPIGTVKSRISLSLSKLKKFMIRSEIYEYRKSAK